MTVLSYHLELLLLFDVPLTHFIILNAHNNISVLTKKGIRIVRVVLGPNQIDFMFHGQHSPPQSFNSPFSGTYDIYARGIGLHVSHCRRDVTATPISQVASDVALLCSDLKMAELSR